MFYVIGFIIMFLPVILLYPTKVLHKENLPKKGKKAILTSNHFSNFDPIIYDIFLFRKFRYMGKKELFDNKFVGFFMKDFGGFPVDREQITPSTYKTAMGLLKNDKQLFIFPEGTRNKTGTNEIQEIKSGFLIFASKGETAITPMLLYRKPKAFRKNYIIVGKPFELVGENPKRLTKEELEENLERYLQVLSDLRTELNDYVDSKKRKKNKKSA
jgi:1-acyl-sn-glycerol-3-phosphate acyltransferase